MASEAAGSAEAPQHECGMLDECGDPECHRADLHFQVWKLPTRRIHGNANHSWRIGVRLGPEARGATRNWVQSVRELLDFLHAKGLIGFPPATINGASLGFSRTAHGSSIVAMNFYEARKLVVIRSVGTPTARIKPRVLLSPDVLKWAIAHAAPRPRA